MMSSSTHPDDIGPGHESVHMGGTEVPGSGQSGKSDPRPGKGLSAERAVHAGFAVALACLALVGIVSFLSVLRLNRDAAQVAHTYEVLNRLDALLTAVTDAQIGGRRYITLGNNEYLDQYRRAAETIHAILPQVRQLTADNALQQRRLAAVQALTAERLTDLATVIELRQSHGSEVAQHADPSRGRQLYDQLRQAVDGMKSTEEGLLRARQTRTRQATIATEAVIIVGGLLAISVAAMALIAIRRDFAGRYRAERALRTSNEALELRVKQRTAELEQTNESLRQGELRLQTQLARLHLLSQITRAIGERHDVRSIFQVVIRTVEVDLPVDFCCICRYDATDYALTVSSVGVHGASLAVSLGMSEQARIPIDENGLSRCVRGELVYEPDLSEAHYPFPQRLVGGGLRCLVSAPLVLENEVFGVLIAARVTPLSFSSSDCEFLRQVSEHVALATHQAQLHQALQHAYDDLRQTQHAVLQHERLLALGRMASGIAHDINNAMSPVSLYMDMILERAARIPADLRGYLEIIQRAIGDVAETVSRMRYFYRQDEPRQQLLPVDLNGVLSQVLELTRARWNDMAQERGTVIEVHTELAANLPQINGMESELRDALINLVFNALDAMPEGGHLHLRTCLHETHSAWIPTGSSQTGIQLQIQDSGIGMDEETRRRCLEPFFTTKGDRGTGLGLAMVYGTLQRHSADIDIRSAVGQGTTVILTFPMPSASVSDPTSLIRVRVVPPQRILLVDDDPIILNSLRDTLEADGHHVSLADGGQSGIDMFSAAQVAGEPFQIVITDLGMPHLDGRAVSRAVKSADPDVLVVLLTGWGRRLVEDGDIPAHVDHVLSKPPKLREIRETLAGYFHAANS